VVLAAGHALIRGLRKQGSEVELTQALAGVLAAEPRMAADFVRLVFDRAPHGGRVDLNGLPELLECLPEQRVEEGRADLSFVDYSRRWHVIVEIKIHAGYGHDQVARYLRSLNNTPKGALAAITRDVPTSGDLAGDDSRWAGSVQWSRLLPGLRKLIPDDEQLQAQWPLFLDVLEEEGSMGFTGADAQLFEAWAKFPAAKDHLIAFVDTLRRAAFEALTRELSAADETDRALPRTAKEVKSGKAGSVVRSRFGKIVVAYQVPADRPGERLWIGLWGHSQPRFMVEIPWPADDDPVRQARVVESLLAFGFESWKDKQLTRYLPLDATSLSSPDLEARVLSFVAESFRRIAQSGVFALASETLDPEAPLEE
jgi:hypothetical protein